MLRPLRCLPAILGLVLLAGCFDPPLGEIGMKIIDGDQSHSCLVMVFNDQGRQIQEVPTDELGVLYIQRLVPGVYTFKFKGSDSHVYPAVRTVTIGPGASAYLQVDLNKEKDPEGEAAASAGGGQNTGDEHEAQP